VAACYVDTSALIKRYLQEEGSDTFDAFCEEASHDTVICPLVATEFTSSLQRRIRLGVLTVRQATAVRQRFLSDVASGGWRMIDFEVDVFARANALLLTLGAPLATLDALHLACALQHGAHEFATADHQLAAAAAKAKLRVHSF
jgi:predicted nucleic acid-binding protein